MLVGVKVCLMCRASGLPPLSCDKRRVFMTSSFSDGGARFRVFLWGEDMSSSAAGTASHREL